MGIAVLLQVVGENRKNSLITNSEVLESPGLNNAMLARKDFLYPHSSVISDNNMSTLLLTDDDVDSVKKWYIEKMLGRLRKDDFQDGSVTFIGGDGRQVVVTVTSLNEKTVIYVRM
jgi:hypothetical protein